MAGRGSTRRFATQPSGNRLERLYQRLARPMPGMSLGGQRRRGAIAFIYPNTAIDLYPDQVNVWQITPDGVDRAARRLGLLPPPASRAR